MKEKLTKKQMEARARLQKARNTAFERFHVDAEYHAEMIDLISAIIASANILDRFVNQFDTLTEKAFITGEMRKIARNQLSNSDRLLDLFLKDEKNKGLFAQTDEQMITMSTYSKYLEQIVRLSTDMDSEEKLIKSVSTMRLIANSK